MVPRTIDRKRMNPNWLMNRWRDKFLTQQRRRRHCFHIRRQTGSAGLGPSPAAERALHVILKIGTILILHCIQLCGGYNYDSTSTLRPFACLSDVINGHSDVTR